MKIEYDKKKQLRNDEIYLKMAEIWSSLSHCKRRKVGSLIVKESMIISDGYNGTPPNFNNCCEDEEGNTHWFVLHAEANALMKLAKSNQNGKEGTLYTTLSPCKECSKLILQAGITRVVYSKKYKDDSGVKFLKGAGVEISFIEIN